MDTNTQITQSPLQSGNSHRHLTLQYNSGSINYGITLTSILHDTEGEIGYCTSVEPVSNEYIDLELDRVSAMSYFYHVPIILCTVFFNIFQNTIALQFILQQLPKGLTDCIIGICAIATAMQALLARAFKIIETPLHLTWAQQALLDTIQQTLETSRKKLLHNVPVALLSELQNNTHQENTLYISIENDVVVYEVLGPDNNTVIKDTIDAQELGKEFPKDDEQLLSLKKEIFSIVLRRQHIQKDLVVLISFQESVDMHKPLFFASKNKNNFDYALQALAKEYHTHLHLLSVDEENYNAINFTALPIQKKYTVLAYSYEPFLATQDTEQNNPPPLTAPDVYSSSVSLKRYISHKQYREKISNCAITCNLLCSLPSFLFLVALPYMGATLQGISSLNDVLTQCSVKEIYGNTRWAVIVPGVGIGASKATMTKVTKVPPAEERTHEIYALLCETLHDLKILFGCSPSNTSQPIVIQKKSDREFFQDLYNVFSFDCSFSFLKRILIIAYYAIPLLIKFFGKFSAIGTIFFYAGLGLFFSNSAMYELAALSTNPLGHTPVHESTDYSNLPITIISGLMCIAIAILNGFFNQGWEAGKLFNRYAKETAKHLHHCIESGTVTSLCHLLQTPEIIKSIFTKNTWGQNTVLFLTLIDSFAASATAYYGSTKIMAACATLYPPLEANNLSAIFNFLIALSIYISQTCFSFELYERDAKVGGNLWGKLFAVHLPECLKSKWLKETFKLDKMKFTHTQGASDYRHQCYNRLRAPLTHFSHHLNSCASMATSSSSIKFGFS